MPITPETISAFRDEFEKIAAPSLLGKLVANTHATKGRDAAANVLSRFSKGKGGTVAFSKRREYLRAGGRKFHELEKRSGEMQGYTRIGRKPISIDKMLENEEGVTSPTEELLKAAAISGKAMALLAAGGAGALTVRQANEDRKIGRMVRKQQQAQQ
jgi:hypothetical protein